MGSGAGRVPALDGLRGLAILFVVLYHARAGWAQGGGAGVSIFFPLSGYLITTLLVEEWRRAGRISLARFWQRRARRLVPGAVLGVVFAVVVAGWRHARPTVPEVASALTGWKNWQLIAHGRFGEALTVWWSLSVEEQFYALFPLAVLGTIALYRRPPSGRAVAVLAVASWAAMVATAARSPMVAYYGSHTRAWELLAGCALALGRGLPRLLRVPPALAGAALLAVHTSLARRVARTAVGAAWERWDQPLRTTIVVACTVVLIDAAVNRRALAVPLRRVLASRPLRFAAQGSYETYVTHTTVLLAVPWLARGGTLNWCGFVAVALTLGWLVHRATARFRTTG